MAESIPASPSVARSLLRISGPAVLIVAVASISIGAWWLNRDRGAVNSTEASQRVSPGSATRDALDQGEVLLARARLALSERRLLAPAGDNAIEYYLQIQDIESTHVAAHQALLELIPPATAAVESVIAAGELDEGQRQLELLQRMGAGELSTGPLRTALENARNEIERVKIAAAQVAEIAEQAPAVAAAAPAPAAPVAVGKRDPAPSTALAKSAPPIPAPVTPSEPAPTPPAKAEAPTVSVQEPRQIVDARPAYPSTAMQRRIEGWVELELGIGPNGDVIDVVVVRSQPLRIFDREAARAAQRWRFEPRRENGVAVASRVRKTLSFKLKAG